MATYGHVLQVLAALFGDGEAPLGGPLYGRLKNLQRFGIPLGLQIGKGKKIDYQSEQIFQIAFCLQLENAGVKPAQVARIVSARWSDTIFDLFKKEMKSPSKDNDRVLLIATSEMKSADDFILAISNDIGGAIKSLRKRGFRQAIVVNLTAIVHDVAEQEHALVPDALVKGRK
jgi:hypothetical protein